MSRPGRIPVDRPYALVDGRGYALTSQGAGAGSTRCFVAAGPRPWNFDADPRALP